MCSTSFTQQQSHMYWVLQYHTVTGDRAPTPALGGTAVTSSSIEAEHTQFQHIPTSLSVEPVSCCWSMASLANSAVTRQWNLMKAMVLAGTMWMWRTGPNSPKFCSAAASRSHLISWCLQGTLDVHAMKPSHTCSSYPPSVAAAAIQAWGAGSECVMVSEQYPSPRHLSPRGKIRRNCAHAEQ
jgi:hypothetical protein